MPLRCPSLGQRPHAIALGKGFAASFAKNSAAVGKGEVDLFREMRRSLKATAHPPQVVVEEYHGTNHLVAFAGNGGYSRSSACCELSDLLVIVFDRQTGDARLTYVQAKSERTVSANAQGVAGRDLVANLEQWDLLNRRPLLVAARGRFGRPGTFKPPAGLLKNAVLDSVGSFAFFLHGPSGVEIYYAAASALSMPRPYATRTGKLSAVADFCRCGPEPECLSVYGAAEFGAFLFGLMIGTPILRGARPMVAPATGRWLAEQLRGFAVAATKRNESAVVAAELADLLDPDRGPASPTPNVGVASFLLIGIDAAEKRAQ